MLWRRLPRRLSHRSSTPARPSAAANGSRLNWGHRRERGYERTSPGLQFDARRAVRGSARSDGPMADRVERRPRRRDRGFFSVPYPPACDRQRAALNVLTEENQEENQLSAASARPAAISAKPETVASVSPHRVARSISTKPVNTATHSRFITPARTASHQHPAASHAVRAVAQSHRDRADTAVAPVRHQESDR